MTELLELIPEELLPNPCWYSSKNNQPRRMKLHTGICLHKISAINILPNDPFNVSKIIYDIMLPLKVSYNILVPRNGEERLWVPLDYQSFHAGRSRYKGQDYCNKFMIGIGIVSTGKKYNNRPAYQDIQIQKVAEICGMLLERYGIKKDDIVSHEYIRAAWNDKYPDRKADSREGDPGDQLPWEALYDYIEDF